MKLHSVVDVITNSSTTVYVYPSSDAIDKAKEFFKEIFSYAGMNMTNDDLAQLFDFHFELDSDYLEYDGTLMEEDNKVLQDYLKEIGIEYGEFSKKIGNWGALESPERETRTKLLDGLAKKVEKLFNEGQYELTEIRSYEETPSIRHLLSLIVTPKNGEPFDLQRRFGSIFDAEGMR